MPVVEQVDGAMLAIRKRLVVRHARQRVELFFQLPDEAGNPFDDRPLLTGAAAPSRVNFIEQVLGSQGRIAAPPTDDETEAVKGGLDNGFIGKEVRGP